MGRFVFRRFLSLIPTMFLIITFSFFLIRLAPGGPFSSEKKVTEEVMQNLLKKYHMDEPLYKQYFRYLGGVTSTVLPRKTATGHLNAFAATTSTIIT